MHPQVEFLEHWALVGALLTFAEDNPASPSVSIEDAALSAGLSMMAANQIATECVNFGLVSASYEQDAMRRLAITPLGVFMLATDREMRAGRSRGPQFDLPEGADRAIFAIQMGYDEVRTRRPLNAYRSQIDLRTLDVPLSSLLSRLDDAVEAIRESNTIAADIKEQVLSKVAEGRKRFALGTISIAALSLLILNPLQEAINALSEEVLKPRIEAAAKVIRTATGI